MTKNEAKNWLDMLSAEHLADAEVIVLAPYTLLDFVSGYASEKSLNINVGAQNVSVFGKGAYTGEINSEQLREFCKYVLVGHSERKRNFLEDPEIIKKKVQNAISGSLTPVICISDYEEARGFEFANEAVFAYEPPGSISTDQNSAPQDLDKVREFAEKFQSTFKNELIYGGSVDADNVRSYISIPGVSGVLVGAQSLDPHSFSDIIKNAI
jgi:triosephosphate isomerase